MRVGVDSLMSVSFRPCTLPPTRWTGVLWTGSRGARPRFREARKRKRGQNDCAFPGRREYLSTLAVLCCGASVPRLDRTARRQMARNRALLHTLVRHNTALQLTGSAPMRRHARS